MPEPLLAGDHSTTSPNTTSDDNDRIFSPPKSPLVPEAQLPLPDLCARIHARVAAFLEEEPPTARVRGLQQQTRVSLRVIEEALERYGLAELSLSYNGGKDCLVLLILYLCVLHTKVFSPSPSPSSSSSSTNPTPTVARDDATIQSVYIQAPHPFPEVESFVASSVRTYSLSLATYAKPMKAAFADYLHETPSVKAIFVGTRRTDPHGGQLTHFDPTDHGWPDFMRVHPVIDWHYVEIWTFIRYFDVPYCPLYDRGYTSLGGTTDTHPNPALRRNPDDEAAGYRPAYELVEDEAERLGRDW